MPREGAIVPVLTARIEELVVVLFLPVFFAVTGLKTDLLQALDGRMLGVTVAVVLIASGGKLIGTLLPAARGGLGWRDAATLAASFANATPGAIMRVARFARDLEPPHLHIAAPPVSVMAVGVGSQARHPGCFIIDGDN
jgi:hypothetical protein